MFSVLQSSRWGPVTYLCHLATMWQPERCAFVWKGDTAFEAASRSFTN